MQPVPTSAHRSPSVHVPGDLDTCTHVFVRRGGVQPTLTTPYDGPFRVISRSTEGFKIDFPGHPSDLVALSRLRPAIMAPPEDDLPSQENEQDLNGTPPTPPPPGRRPGPRTRFPAPSDRVTRSAASRQPETRQPQEPEDEPIPCGDNTIPGSPPASQPPEPPPSPSQRNQPVSIQEQTAEPASQVPIGDQPPQDLSPTPGPVTASAPVPARRFTSRQERNFSNRGALVPALPPNQPARQESTDDRGQGGVLPNQRRVLSFSNPQPGHFSFRRRRPDVSALKSIIRSHLS